MLQLKSLMEREALEGSQSNTASPNKSQPEELFLFPAESSTLTTLPGVARVVHSKASCTVHWLESGKHRPNAKELPAAQILGIHTALAPRTGTKSGRGNGAASVGASLLTGVGETRRTEPINAEPSLESSAKAEEKRHLSSSVPASSQQTVGSREEGTGLSDGGKPCTGVEAGGGLAVTKTMDKLCSGVESTSEQWKEEHSTNTSSPEATPIPPAKPQVMEEGASHGSAPAAKERTVEQIKEEGWSARDAENVTLAELYLMLGKPGKLQLEYEWQPFAVPASNQENGQTQPKPDRTQRVLRCLLRLVATEVNPKPLVCINCFHDNHLLFSWACCKPRGVYLRTLMCVLQAPELCSTATSPLKAQQEDQNQALTPPAKGPAAGVRSPSCGRHQASVRGGRLHLANAGASGILCSH